MRNQDWICIGVGSPGNWTFDLVSLAELDLCAEYLLCERDSKGQPREGVEILAGDPLQVSAVADSLESQHRYTSAVITWAAVLHRESNGGAHVHVLAARCGLETGRSQTSRRQDGRRRSTRYRTRSTLSTAGRSGASPGAADGPLPSVHRRAAGAGRAGG